jgi:hypothetical protein
MSDNQDMKIRLEDLKAYMYNEIHNLIEDNKGLDGIDRDNETKSGLQKFKPSKHRRAYKLENNFKKRCYVR